MRSASSLSKAQALAFQSEMSDAGGGADGTLAINCHKKGLFGKRQSLQTMMTWSRVLTSSISDESRREKSVDWCRRR